MQGWERQVNSDGGLGVFDRGFDPGFIYLSLGQGGVLGQE